MVNNSGEEDPISSSFNIFLIPSNSNEIFRFTSSDGLASLIMVVALSVLLPSSNKFSDMEQMLVLNVTLRTPKAVLEIRTKKT